jgi:protein tyrosine/serine phosphatase
MGIKAIINLRAGDERSRLEEDEARAVGLNYFNVPFRRLGRPTDEQIALVLSLINAPENQPVFVHCNHGADRTGIVIAIYRIDHDGWSNERAKAEANRYGLKPWQIRKKKFIDNYSRRRSPHVAAH